MWQIACPSVTDAATILGKADWVAETSIFGTSLHIGTHLSREEAPSRIRQALEQAGVSPVTVSEIEPSLEDVFIHVIKRSGGDES
jgi:hypothetical protein